MHAGAENVENEDEGQKKNEFSQRHDSSPRGQRPDHHTPGTRRLVRALYAS